MRVVSPSLVIVNLYQIFCVGLGIKPTYLNQFVLSVEICLFKPINEIGVFTVSVAVSALPVRARPPPVAMTVLVVFSFAPAVLPVTVTLKVQLALAASDPPERLMEFPPLTTRLLPTPQTSFVVPFVAVNPAGQPAPESVKAIPVSAVDGFGFVIVKLIVEVSLSRIELRLTDFDNVGGAMTFNGEVP